MSEMREEEHWAALLVLRWCLLWLISTAWCSWKILWWENQQPEYSKSNSRRYCTCSSLIQEHNYGWWRCIFGRGLHLLMSWVCNIYLRKQTLRLEFLGGGTCQEEIWIDSSLTFSVRSWNTVAVNSSARIIIYLMVALKGFNWDQASIEPGSEH